MLCFSNDAKNLILVVRSFFPCGCHYLLRSHLRFHRYACNTNWCGEYNSTGNCDSYKISSYTNNEDRRCALLVNSEMHLSVLYRNAEILFENLNSKLWMRKTRGRFCHCNCNLQTARYQWNDMGVDLTRENEKYIWVTATVLKILHSVTSFPFVRNLPLRLQPQSLLQNLRKLQVCRFNKQLWKQRHEVSLWNLNRESTNNKRVIIYKISDNTFWKVEQIISFCNLSGLLVIK